MIDLKTAPDDTLDQVLALNAAVEDMTSPLDMARLRRLLGWSAMAPAVVDEAGRVDAFLIGMAPGSGYDSPNYRWFANALTQFAYIDRVVVAPHAQGRGLARGLYAAFGAEAAAQGLGPLCCEVNIEPPNPASDAFHTRLGFGELGRARLGPGKVVRYLTRAG